MVAGSNPAGRTSTHRPGGSRRAEPGSAAPEAEALGVYVPFVQTVGIVSPGAMGSAVGAAYLAAGNRVVTTVAGRSDRTIGLAEQAGLELLPDLDAVVSESELVLSIVPPGEAGVNAAAIAAAAGRTGSRPLVRGLERGLAGDRARARTVLAEADLELVERLYLRRPAACRLPHARLSLRTICGRARRGGAGVDLCPHCRRHGWPRLRREDVHGVDVQGIECPARARTPDRARAAAPTGAHDLGGSFPRQIERAARMLAVSATKADRYVAEMREIAATQAAVGLTPALFEAMAEVYEDVARSAVAAEAPEAIPSEPDLEDVLDGISPR